LVAALVASLVAALVAALVAGWSPRRRIGDRAGGRAFDAVALSAAFDAGVGVGAGGAGHAARPHGRAGRCGAGAACTCAGPVVPLFAQASASWRPTRGSGSAGRVGGRW